MGILAFQANELQYIQPNAWISNINETRFYREYSLFEIKHNWKKNFKLHIDAIKQ